MAYIPPHKRQSKDTDRPLPTPYPDANIIRWFIIGLNEDNQLPSSVHLDKLTSLKTTGRKELLVLVNSCLDKENNQVRENTLSSPWVSIAENVQQHLLSSFEIVRNEMECQELEKVKPTLVARVGKNLFLGSPLLSQESVNRSQVAEIILRKLKKILYTNIPTSYMEYIIGVVAPNIGIDFEEKERYRVHLYDSVRDATVLCKCRVEHQKKLEPYKFETLQVPHMVEDILCLDKGLDLRLMLCTKKILTALTDDEKHCIRDLINSADFDSSVKGGLIWPLGKDSSGGRFRVGAVQHLTVKAYESPSLRLKVIQADRYGFKSLTREVTWEIDLKLKKVLSELQQEKVEINSISDTLKENLRLIWDHFLCCERFLT